jgi:hypothetical protein
VAAEVRDGRLAQARSHSGFVPTGFGTAGFGGIEAGPTRTVRSGSAPADQREPEPEREPAPVSDLDRKRAERARKRAEEAQAAKSVRKAELDQARRS